MPEIKPADPSSTKDCGNAGKYFMSSFIGLNLANASNTCHLSHLHKKMWNSLYALVTI